MKSIRLPLFFLLLTFLFNACGGEGEVYLSPYRGSAGEVVVVIDDAHWESKAGGIIKDGLYLSVPGLDKNEPSFTLLRSAEKNFGQLLRVHRNVLLVRIEDTDANEIPRIEFRKNVWASEQLVIEINVRDADAFEGLFNDNLNQIVGILNQMDRDRLMDKYNKQRNVAVKKKLEEKQKLSLFVPRDFEIVKESDDFLWIRRQMQKFLRNNYGGAHHDINQNIFIYSYAYTDTSMFNPDFQLMMRDSILKEHVPGNVVGSYMTTERVHFQPVYAEREVMNQYALEVRGLWKLDGAPGAFMGGPFIGLSCYDEKNGRIIYIEGNVFAPKFDKREYMRELEAMIYSIRVPEETTSEEADNS